MVTIIYKYSFLHFVLFLLLTSCTTSSTNQVSDLTSGQFDLKIEQQRKALSDSEFRQWLDKERQTLVEQREGIRGVLYSSSERGSYQETRTSPTQSSGLNDFNVQMTNLELARLQEKLKVIERKLRTIDALQANRQN